MTRSFAKIVHRCHATERSVVVWGAGAAGRRVLNLVLDLGGTIDAFVDNNPAKDDERLPVVLVIDPRMLASPEWLGSVCVDWLNARGRDGKQAAPTGSSPTRRFHARRSGPRWDTDTLIAMAPCRGADTGDGWDTPGLEKPRC